jgi:hypothetical protein
VCIDNGNYCEYYGMETSIEKKLAEYRMQKAMEYRKVRFCVSFFGNYCKLDYITSPAVFYSYEPHYHTAVMITYGQCQLFNDLKVTFTELQIDKMANEMVCQSIFSHLIHFIQVGCHLVRPKPCGGLCGPREKAVDITLK